MNSIYGNQNINGLAAALMHAKRRKVFVSYHHGNDQFYYDEFTRLFHDQYEAIRDNSLDRIIQSIANNTRDFERALFFLIYVWDD